MSKHAFGTIAAALALLSPQAAGATPTSYSDPTGDIGPAADIGVVTVDVAADGYIVIKPAVANMPAFGQPGFVALILDTDRNSATGSLSGGDYVLGFDRGDATLAFLRWSGTEYVGATGDVTVVVGAGTIEFRIRPEAIGGATSFSFSVVASTGTSGEQIDLAPDSGMWFFERAQPVVVPVTVEKVDAKFAPAVPRAGKTFGAPRVRITLSNGKTIVAQKYRCVARLGGRPLRGNGKGGCTFKLPENAKGKRLRVSLFVTYGGITDGFDPYVFKVR
jgi:hypothetical protein